MARTSLRLQDYDDRDLLHLLDDLADNEGWVANHLLVERLNIKTKYPRRSISSRLGALGRLGVVERTYHHGQSHWKLTPVAQDMLDSKLKTAGQRMVEDGTAATLWHITDILGARALSMPMEASHMIRRQMTHYYLVKRARERAAQEASIQ